MRLYKYVTPQRIDILRNERIRVTPPSELNDPFELRPYFEVLVQEEELLESLTGRDLAPHLLKAYQERSELHFLSQQQFLEMARSLLGTSAGQQQVSAFLSQTLTVLREQNPQFRQMVYDQLSKVGILSLSETATSVLMWSHYADSHTGFVLEVDALHPALNRRRSGSDEFFHPRLVLYREPRQGVALINLRAEEFFLLKAPHWSYESEWRILVPLEYADAVDRSGDVVLHFLHLPAPVVIAVTLGARVSAALRQDIVRLKQDDPRYHHVELREAYSDDSRGAIVLRDARHSRGVV